MVPLMVLVPIVIVEAVLSNVKPAEAGIENGVPVARLKFPERL